MRRDRKRDVRMRRRRDRRRRRRRGRKISEEDRGEIGG